MSLTTGPGKPVGGADYYSQQAIQPIEYIESNKLPWHEGNVVKYITRWRLKGGIADLDKVIFYATRLKQIAEADGFTLNRND